MKTMTVQQLRDALEGLDGSQPFKVWLPGSTISLGGNSGKIMGWNAVHQAVLVEGNVDPGSALDDFS